MEDDNTRRILEELLERLTDARSVVDVNIAAGIAAQELAFAADILEAS